MIWFFIYLVDKKYSFIIVIIDSMWRCYENKDPRDIHRYALVPPKSDAI